MGLEAKYQLLDRDLSYAVSAKYDVGSNLIGTFFSSFFSLTNRRNDLEPADIGGVLSEASFETNEGRVDAADGLRKLEERAGRGMHVHIQVGEDAHDVELVWNPAVVYCMVCEVVRCVGGVCVEIDHYDAGYNA